VPVVEKVVIIAVMKIAFFILKGDFSLLVKKRLKTSAIFT
jgi:hypothetical protein